MLVFKTIKEELPEGVWHERVLWGERIRFKIRPRVERIIERIREKHKRRKSGEDVYDTIKIGDEVLDYYIEDIEGIGVQDDDGTVRSIEINMENKIKVLAMPVPQGEQPLHAWVVDRAAEDGFLLLEEEAKK